MHLLSNIIRTERLPHEFCPGCAIGQIYHYAAKAVEELGINMDKVVFLSGIGCNSRGVGYVRFDSATTLHGRALAFATGIKLANPDLTVIVVTGDGDGAGIGGNHLIHAARRNIDLTVILYNNMVYASTGGQLAPTTPYGTYTSTTPYGNLEEPFDLCSLVTAAGAVYVARWTTAHPYRAISSIKKGILKKGFAFIEIVGQCPTYFGRYILKTTDPAKCLKWLLENSVLKSSTTETRDQGKIVVGEFVDRERPELTEQYRILREKIKTQGVHYG
jgi:2-oxoglutarate ferredoxin oxidoreductase subunit beta